MRSTVGIGKAPLIGLECAHRPADCELDPLDVEPLGHQPMMGADIVLDRDRGKPAAVG